MEHDFETTLTASDGIRAMFLGHDCEFRSIVITDSV